MKTELNAYTFCTLKTIFFTGMYAILDLNLKDEKQKVSNSAKV